MENNVVLRKGLPLRAGAAPMKGILFSLLIIVLNLLAVYLLRHYYFRRPKSSDRRIPRSSRSSDHSKRKDNKKAKPNILLLLGIAGSGKSTWLAQYMERCDHSYGVVDGDEIRLGITGKFDDFSREEEVCDAMIHKIVKYVNRHRNVVVESTRHVMDEEFRKRIVDSIPECRLLVKEFPIKAHFAYARLAKDAEDGKRHHAYTEFELEDMEALFETARVLMKKEGWSQLLDGDMRPRSKGN